MNNIAIRIPREFAQWQKDSNTLLRRRTEKEIENVEASLENLEELAKTLPHLDYGSRVSSQREYIAALQMRLEFIDQIDAALEIALITPGRITVVSSDPRVIAAIG